MKVKIFVSDVDGTLTDGKLYFGPTGEILKVFNVKDGLGFSKLHKAGIVPVIITGRESEIVKKRCEDLKINFLYQGIKNKIEILKKLAEINECNISDIAFIGDDDNDLECVKASGISACPSDASKSIINEVNFLCKKEGGAGAVREFIDFLLKHHS